MKTLPAFQALLYVLKVLEVLVVPTEEFRKIRIIIVNSNGSRNIWNLTCSPLGMCWVQGGRGCVLILQDHKK